MTRRPMPSRRASRFISLSAVALAAAGLTACGSGTHHAAASSTSAATTTHAGVARPGEAMMLPRIGVGPRDTPARLLRRLRG